MKSMTCHATLACLMLWSALPTALAETVTEDEAWVVAENYVQLVINRQGDWDGADTANVVSMTPLARADRTLGYFFQVEPQGFILVSLCTEFTPVKAYSTRSTPDPGSEVGLIDLLKTRLLRTIEYIESETGLPIDQLTPKDWEPLTGTDYRPAWDVLTDADFDATQYRTGRRGRSIGMNYQEGDTLLTSRWHQAPPYNDACPDLGCDWPNYDYYNSNALVGCVATAGAQILRYWNWPPCNSLGQYVDAYNWSNMPGVISIYGPQDQIDCVAAASYSVANSVGMDFGCDGSSADTYDMEPVFEYRRYDDYCSVVYREEYSNDDWFDMLVAEFNVNRPVEYRVEGHAIVGDGWQITYVGGVPTQQLHFIYGWYDSHDTWYSINDIHLGGVDIDYMVRRVLPDVALGSDLSGHYATPSDPGVYFDKPTRYFDVDASGQWAEFDAGQTFQYPRPGLHIQHVGPYSEENYIMFSGAPDAMSEFYQGAPTGDTRIRIHDGFFKMMNGCEICLH